MAEFTKDRYGVDVMKVEIPINMKFVEGAKACTGASAYTRDAAKQWFLESAKVATKPFIYLSAGVSNAEFTESLALASESACVFRRLCGRATWKDGISVYAKEGGAAFRSWLDSKGVENINNVNAALKRAAPWFSFYGPRAAELDKPLLPIISVPLTGPGTSCRSRESGSCCSLRRRRAVERTAHGGWPGMVPSRSPST
jgi:tagatose 1,6-diphosphate aldolase